MRPELFQIPLINMPVYGYGLMIVLGLLAAIQLAKALARRSGLDPDFFVNAALIALASGVIGARIVYIAQNWPQFSGGESLWANLFAMINLREGGLVFYGGLILGLPITIFYAIRRNMPVLRGMDVVAPCIMIALGLGRIGCLFNGCCHGAACDLPWALEFPYHSNAYVEQYYSGQIDPHPDLLATGIDGGTVLAPPAMVRDDPHLATLAAAERSLPVHPTQVYSSINALLIAAALVAYYTLPHSAGSVFALMMILKGVTRFLLETIRTEPAFLGPMTLSMVVSILLVLAGIAFFLITRRLDPAPRAPLSEPATASGTR